MAAESKAVNARLMGNAPDISHHGAWFIIPYHTAKSNPKFPDSRSGKPAHRAADSSHPANSASNRAFWAGVMRFLYRFNSVTA